ncbi:unnamed protein product [Prunus armeniaca]|uniref:Uncharacterized protein n=1 Tax=Prunus armeniaca TaxID=36596 RepID=A0A6J5WNQ2_PRUAR|nr:unnamed protein product [Prunus armeniaca]
MKNLGHKETCEGISNEVPTTGRLEETTSRQVICLEPTSCLEEATGRQAIFLESTNHADDDDRSHTSIIDDCQEMTDHPEEATGR